MGEVPWGKEGISHPQTGSCLLRVVAFMIHFVLSMQLNSLFLGSAVKTKPLYLGFSACVFFILQVVIKKLELSWAKLSLAGAIVFGLGIVEF